MCQYDEVLAQMRKTETEITKLKDILHSEYTDYLTDAQKTVLYFQLRKLMAIMQEFPE